MWRTVLSRFEPTFKVLTAGYNLPDDVSASDKTAPWVREYREDEEEDLEPEDEEPEDERE